MQQQAVCSVSSQASRSSIRNQIFKQGLPHVFLQQALPLLYVEARVQCSAEKTHGSGVGAG